MGLDLPHFTLVAVEADAVGGPFEFVSFHQGHRQSRLCDVIAVNLTDQLCRQQPPGPLVEGESHAHGGVRKWTLLAVCFSAGQVLEELWTDCGHDEGLAMVATAAATVGSPQGVPRVNVAVPYLLLLHGWNLCCLLTLDRKRLKLQNE